MGATRAGHISATTGSAPTASGTTATDEWEYEYDENETEYLYFTLDVTTLQSQSGLKTTHINKGKTATQPPDQLQVLDLHSDNPLIKLGECFYSCNWSTDLSTQFYVAKPGIDENPLRPGHVLDVIGTSRVRLTGDPVTLHRRRPDAPEKAVGSTTADAIALDDAGDVTSTNSTPTAISTTEDRVMRKNIKRLATARQNARDPLVKAQASFLERLAIIKHKKGEKDAVPVYGVDTVSASSARGTNVSTSNGKRKSVPNDVLDSPVASNSTKKLIVALPHGASGLNVDPETPQIQHRESDHAAETRSTMLGSSNVGPQLHPGGVASYGNGIEATRTDEDLRQTASNDASRSTEAEASNPRATDQPQAQP